MKNLLFALLLAVGFGFGLTACDDIDLTPDPDYPTECPDGGEGSCRE